MCPKPKGSSLTLHHLAALVHWPGMAIYGAVLSIFADKLLVQRKAQRDTLVAFLAWGSALGLAMGAWVFGGIGLHPLQYGLA